MGIRDYLKDPAGRRSISQAIRGAFERKRGAAGRILVIDVDPLSRETLVRALERANYRADGAASEAEAVALPDLRAVDLVIRDTRSPEDETDSSAALREHVPQRKILTVTSHEGHATAALSREAATNVLVRPFDSKQLLQAVKRALQQDV